MPIIKLDNIKATPAVNTFLYKDVALDLRRQSAVTNSLYRSAPSNDIEVSIDEAAIKNSLINLFTTSPGQKLLNPTYGLNLNQFLFSPMTEDNAEEIGERILNGINTYEPRVTVINVNVNMNEEQQEYEIDLTLGIPSLSNSTVSFSGILGNPGFTML